ncbi:MAG: protein kinase [Sumerlaeia bacterium]
MRTLEFLFNRNLIFGTQFKVLTLFCASSIMFTGVVSAQNGLKEAFPPFETNLDNPQSPLVVQLFHDETPELVLSDVRGNIGVYYLTDKGYTLLVRKNLGEGISLSSPTVGRFFDEPTQQILVGTSEGSILILDPATLEERASYRSPDSASAINLRPVIFTIPNPEDESIDAKQVEAIFYSDESSKVNAIYLDSEGKFKRLWEPVSAGARIMAPLTEGRPRNFAQRDLLVPTSSGSIVIIDLLNGVPASAPASSYRYLVEENQSIGTSILAMNVTGDSRDELIFSMEIGVFKVCQFNESAGGKLPTIWQEKMGNAPIGHPVLLTDPFSNSSQSWKMAFLATSKTLYAFKPDSPQPSTWRLIQGTLPLYSEINTALAVLPRDGNFPFMITGMGNDLAIFDTSTWPKGESTKDVLKVNLGTRLQGSPVISARKTENGSFRAMVVATSSQGTIFTLDSDLEAIPQTNTPWMAVGGNPRHSMRLDALFYQDLIQLQSDQRGLLAGKLAELEAFTEAKDWEAAEATAEWLIRFDPLSEEYKTQLSSIRFSKNFLTIVTSTLAVIIGLGYLAFVIVRSYSLNRLEKKAKSALDQENLTDAEKYYEQLVKKRPKRTRYVATLAMVYSNKNNLNADTLPVYKKAIELDGNNKRILNSYALALFNNQEYSDEATVVYQKCLNLDSEYRGILLYALGKGELNKGNLDSAIGKFQESNSAGFNDPRLDEDLCMAYVGNGHTSPSALQLYQKMAHQNQNNLSFLETYLFACIANNIKSKEVESLCFQVQEANPSNLLACGYLAQEYIHRGETGAAIDEANRMLEINENHLPALDILAQAYSMERRKDKKAETTYLRLLDLKPDHQNALSSLVELYYSQDRFDGAALKIFKASFKLNPDHPETLKSLARSAKLSGDSALAISALEGLFKIGKAENEHHVQLALAYIAEGKIAADYERVFKDALRIDGDNEKISGALATIYANAKRDDAEAMALYESYYKISAGNIKIGKQLVRAFAANQRFEEALETAKALKEASPNDPDIEGLIAYCKLYGNKLDDAVNEYEAILQRDPNNKDAQIHLAEAYAQKSRVDAESLRLYERALVIDPRNEAIILSMASVYISKNDTVNAIQQFQQFLKYAPNQEERLIKKVQLILKEKPDLIRVRWFLCEVLVSFGRLREAMDNLKIVYQDAPNQGKNIQSALDKILAKDKNNFAALALKGRILNDSGETVKAMEMLEAAYKLQPTNEDLMVALANCYEQVLQKRESSETRFRLGRLYYMTERYDEAIAAFQQTAQDFRTEAASGKMLGRCYIAKELYDLAFGVLQKVVVDDEVKELLYDLAKRLEGRQEIGAAKNVYRQLFAADINYKDVKVRFEALSNPDSSMGSFGGGSSDSYERTSVMQQMSEDAKRRYELLEELGRGAMGIVYRAKDKELEEVVALKILPDQLSSNEEAVRRFKIEARNARKLSHPHIVRIHDIGEEAGRRYISMEFVDGSDLKKKIKTEGRINLESFFKYSKAIASALGYAHTLGIVHRDIKPANIMLDSTDKVKITDFGIAKLLDAGDANEGTMMGAVIGTPLYMSPEQVQGVPVDNRADLYAYGIMLYEFLNTRPPFTKGDLAYQHIHEQPKRIEDCPEEIWQIISKCLEKDKENRWNNAEEILEALITVQKKLS